MNQNNESTKTSPLSNIDTVPYIDCTVKDKDVVHKKVVTPKNNNNISSQNKKYKLRNHITMH